MRRTDFRRRRAFSSDSTEHRAHNAAIPHPATLERSRTGQPQEAGQTTTPSLQLWLALACRGRKREAPQRWRQCKLARQDRFQWPSKQSGSPMQELIPRAPAWLREKGRQGYLSPEPGLSDPGSTEIAARKKLSRSMPPRGAGTRVSRAKVAAGFCQTPPDLRGWKWEAQSWQHLRSRRTPEHTVSVRLWPCGSLPALQASIRPRLRHSRTGLLRRFPPDKSA